MGRLHLAQGWFAVGSLAVCGLWGCEDPPAPTPAGAFALQLGDSGVTCNLATHNAEMGVVGQTGEPDLISDGANGAQVECTVEPSGSAFRVNVALADTASLQVNIASISTSSTVDAPAEGSVSYVSTDTGGDVFASPGTTPCRFWVSPDDGQYLEAGSAWLSFECDAVDNEGDSCEIRNGFFTVKNCEGASNEDSEE